MKKKFKIFSRLPGVLFIFFVFQNSALTQVRQDDLAKKYSEIEGLYLFS